MSRILMHLRDAIVLSWTLTFATATLASSACINYEAPTESELPKSSQPADDTDAPPDPTDQDSDLGQPPSPVLDRGARTLSSTQDLTISGGHCLGILTATTSNDPQSIKPADTPIVVFLPDESGVPRMTCGPPLFV